MRLALCPNCGTNDDNQTACCRKGYEGKAVPKFESIVDVHHSTAMKYLEKGVVLIHEILSGDSIDDDLRHRILKWRSDAEGMLP